MRFILGNFIIIRVTHKSPFIIAGLHIFLAMLEIEFNENIYLRHSLQGEEREKTKMFNFQAQFASTSKSNLLQIFLYIFFNFLR